jgi:hypothetical protein
VSLGNRTIATAIENELAVHISTLACFDVVADVLPRHPMFVGDRSELGSVWVGRSILIRGDPGEFGVVVNPRTCDVPHSFADKLAKDGCRIGLVWTAGGDRRLDIRRAVLERARPHSVRRPGAGLRRPRLDEAPGSAPVLKYALPSFVLVRHVPVRRSVLVHAVDDVNMQGGRAR